MNKEQLQTAIAAIPTFEFRQVATGHNDEQIKEVAGDKNDETQWVRVGEHRAICEVGSYKPLAFVSNRYKLVQFSEMFNPIVEDMEVCDAHLKYFDGMAIMDIYPCGEQFKIENQSIGVSAYNSVNTTSGLVVRFVIKDANGREIALPRKMAHFKKAHVGDVKQVTQDYIKMLGKVKEAWATIVDRFSAHYINHDELPALCEAFGVGDKIQKRLEAVFSNGMDLWSLCMTAFDLLTAQKYKSEIHRRARLDDFSATLFMYKLLVQVA